MRCRRFFAGGVLLPLLLLAGCLLPTDFEARIEIHPNGDFEERFSGLLVEWTPYERMKKGEMTAAKAAETSRKTVEIIAKDPMVRSVREEAPFRYRVEYLRKGNVFEEFKKSKATDADAPERAVFLAEMLYLRRQPDGGLLLERRKVGPGDQERFRRLGLEMKGTLALRIHGAVLEHDVQPAAGGEYRWILRSVTEPSVHLVFRLN